MGGRWWVVARRVCAPIEDGQLGNKPRQTYLPGIHRAATASWAEAAGVAAPPAPAAAADGGEQAASPNSLIEAAGGIDSCLKDQARLADVAAAMDAEVSVRERYIGSYGILLSEPIRRRGGRLRHHARVRGGKWEGGRGELYHRLGYCC